MRGSKSFIPRWLLVVLIVWAVVFFLFADFAPPRSETQKSKAQLYCTSIAFAIEAYTNHPDNKQHEQPTALRELLQPPFGGPSFLRNGEAELLDPWGKPYEMERVRKADGTEIILVKTTAPDGTPISQFGIAGNAQPRD